MPRSIVCALAVLFLPAFAAASTALDPVPRDPAWVKRHEGFVERSREGGIEVVFLGDSITDFWRTVGLEVWNRNYAPLKAVNYGISGDRTQHVLWRIANGELDGISPRVLVLMIGTNNTGLERDNFTVRNTVPETIAGIEAVVAAIRAKLPRTKILLLGLFPRADGPGDTPVRAQIAEVNRAIARLDDGSMVHYLDIGHRFLAPDGALPVEIMPDHLHLSPAGYEIWAAAMGEKLGALLK